MTTTHDHRERELVKCDGCGRLEHRWHRLALTSDGRTIFDVQLCRRCETDTTSAVRMVWEAMATR